MRLSECITNKTAVAERRELLRERFVVLFFFGMKPNVLQEKHAAFAQRFAFGLRIRSDAIVRKNYVALQKLLKLFRYRRQRVFRFGPALWPAKVRRQDQSPTFLNRQPQRRQRLPNARVVADHAIL